jgi:hypothetical protein
MNDVNDDFLVFDVILLNDDEFHLLNSSNDVISLIKENRS